MDAMRKIETPNLKALVEIYIDCKVGFSMMPGHASIESAERAILDVDSAEADMNAAIEVVLQTLASKEAELVRLREESERTARNRDMWKEQCAMQAESLARLRGALREGAQRIESLKRDCGADPDSPIAIQNSRYMGVSSFLRAATQLPKEPT